MRRTTTLLVGLGLLTLTLTACNGSADPPPPSPTPTATSTSATPTPPTPPAMPKAAKAHTKAGAKAFVEYFWDVVNYAQATGDTDAIARLVSDECKGCAAGIETIDKVYRTGGRIEGGEGTVESASAIKYAVGADPVARVTARIHLNASSVVAADGSIASTSPPGLVTDQFRLRGVVGDGPWQVIAFTAVHE